jgi:hypothetical protein
VSALLRDVINLRLGEYTDALRRLRDDGEPNVYGDRKRRSAEARARDVEDMREAMELLRCLRRTLEGKSPREIHDAFGAPGDFGYDTAIGDALARTYQGEVGK